MKPNQKSNANAIHVRNGKENNKKSVWLVMPPFVPGCYANIYPSLPVLSAVLKENKYNPMQFEINNEFIDWFIDSKYFSSKVKAIKNKTIRLENKSCLSSAELAQYHHFKDRIDLLDSLQQFSNVSKRSRIIKNMICRDSNGEVFNLFSMLFPSVWCSVNTGIFKKRITLNYKESHVLLSFFEEYYFQHKCSKPLFIGITIPTAMQLRHALLLSYWFKKKLWSEVPIFFGGPTCTLAEKQVIENILLSNLVDGIVTGEGEESIVEIAKQVKSRIPKFDKVSNLIWIKNGKVICNSLSSKNNIDKYPSPYYDDKLLKKWNINYLTVIVGRKCYWGQCAFCEYPNLYMQCQNKRPASIVRDIKYLIHRHGIRKYYFSTNSLDPSVIEEICHAILNANLKILWDSYIRVDNYSSSLLRLMVKAGCNIVCVGIESLDDQVLRIIRKGYCRNDVFSFLNKLISNNILFETNMIIDLPGTSYKSAFNQYKIMKKFITSAFNNYQAPYYKVAPFYFTVSKTSAIGKEPYKYNIKLLPGNFVNKTFHMNSRRWLDANGMSENEKDIIYQLYIELNEEMQTRYHKILKESDRKQLSDDIVGSKKNRTWLLFNKERYVISWRYFSSNLTECSKAKKLQEVELLLYDYSLRKYSKISNKLEMLIISKLPLVYDTAYKQITNQSKGCIIQRDKFNDVLRTMCNNNLIVFGDDLSRN